MVFNKKVVSLFLTAVIATNASVCKPTSGSCDECNNFFGSATNSDGTLFCSDQSITTTDSGVQFPDGYVLWYKNIRNCGSPCFDEDSSSSSDDSDDDSTDDSDEEGNDVCYTTTKTCCPDSLSTVKGETTNSGGKTYCVKYQAEEVVEGIFYTYPDGKSNTKWWKNIYPCEENRRGLCHYDESDDGPLDQVVILDDGSKGNSNKSNSKDVDNSSVEVEFDIDVEVEVSADDEPDPKDIMEDDHDHFDIDGNETCSGNIREYACDHPDFTIMCDLIGAFDIQEKFNLKDLELTAYFPTDEAFADLFAMADDIELTDALIFNIFLFHFSTEVVEDYFGIECGSKLEMANGKNVRMKCEEKGIVRYMVGGGNDEIGTKPMIVYEDDNDVYDACNGIVFAVDAVMLPGNWDIPHNPNTDPSYVGDSGEVIMTDSKGNQGSSYKPCYPFSNDNCKYDLTVDKVEGCYYKNDPSRSVSMCCPSGETKGWKQDNQIVCPDN